MPIRLWIVMHTVENQTSWSKLSGLNQGTPAPSSLGAVHAEDVFKTRFRAVPKSWYCFSFHCCRRHSRVNADFGCDCQRHNRKSNIMVGAASTKQGTLVPSSLEAVHAEGVFETRFRAAPKTDNVILFHYCRRYWRGNADLVVIVNTMEENQTSWWSCLD